MELLAHLFLEKCTPPQPPTMKRLLLLSLFSISLLLRAQPAASPLWSTDLSGEIVWQKVSALGQLVVQTRTGLQSIDPENGQVLWTNAGVQEALLPSWHEVPGTPFLRLSTGTNSLVIDLLSGRTVLNAFDMGIEEIEHEKYFPTFNALAISGKSGEQQGFWLIDLQVPQLKWKKIDFDLPVAGMASTPNNGVVLATPLKLFHFDLNSGQLRWERYIDAETEQQMKMLGSFGTNLLKSLGAFDMSGVKLDFIDLQDNRFALGYQSKTEEEVKDPSGKVTTKVTYRSGYTFFQLSDGTSFAEDISTNGIRGVLLRGSDGLIISYRGSWGPMINKLDLESKQMLWGKKGKGNKVKGHVVQAFPAEQGILLSMTKDDVPTEKSNYYFNVLDPGTGNLLFEDDLKVKEQVRFMKMVPAGALVITTEEIQLIGLDQQDFLWKDAIEETRTSLTATEGNTLYAFSNKDGLVYEVNLETGSKKALSTEKLKFDQGEDPMVMELRPEGLFLSSDQNVALLSKEGKLLYHQVYEAPRLPGLTRVLAAANALRAAYIGASAYAAAATIENAQNEYANELSEFDNVLLDGFEEVYTELGEAGMSAAGEQWKKVTARFKATRSGNDYVFMLTKGPDKHHRLLRVSKSTGEPDLYVDLGEDKEPVYDLDPVTNRIFYRPNGASLVGY